MRLGRCNAIASSERLAETIPAAALAAEAGSFWQKRLLTVVG